MTKWRCEKKRFDSNSGVSSNCLRLLEGHEDVAEEERLLFSCQETWTKAVERAEAEEPAK